MPANEYCEESDIGWIAREGDQPLTADNLTLGIYRSYVSNEIVELSGVYLKDRQDLCLFPSAMTMPRSVHSVPSKDEETVTGTLATNPVPLPTKNLTRVGSEKKTTGGFA